MPSKCSILGCGASKNHFLCDFTAISVLSVIRIGKNGMAVNGLLFNVVKKIFLLQAMCSRQYNTTNWDVRHILTQYGVKNRYGVIILNRPITQNPHFLSSFWNNAAVRITVDGGTVQWDKYVQQMPEDVQKTLKGPDLVLGDFDSITNEILKKYKNKGCKTIQTPDQNYTDFTKALMELDKYNKENNTEIEYIVAICQSSGRLDQVLGNIQTLFLAEDKSILDPEIKVFLMTDDALSWLLPPGHHVITLPEETINHKRAWCSLVPVGEMCHNVCTTGLKWNLNNQPLKFGELVSTSNTFDGSEKVTVTCSHTILWSMRIPCVMSNFKPCGEGRTEYNSHHPFSSRGCRTRRLREHIGLRMGSSVLSTTINSNW